MRPKPRGNTGCNRSVGKRTHSFSSHINKINGFTNQSSDFTLLVCAGTLALQPPCPHTLALSSPRHATLRRDDKATHKQLAEPAQQQASNELELACFNARGRGRRAACERGKTRVKVRLNFKHTSSKRARTQNKHDRAIPRIQAEHNSLHVM